MSKNKTAKSLPLVYTSHMKTSLVIPAYNEEARLGAFLASVASFSAAHPQLIHEIIIVDDGSRDQTKRIAERYQSELPLKVIAHSANRGKGAAVQTGVMAATGDYIIFMDADGATPITELPKMLAALRNHQIGIGNRWLPGANTQHLAPLRRLSGWLYRHYMALFGLGAIDTMCGFKGYRRVVARALFARLTEERWLFDTEVA